MEVATEERQALHGQPEHGHYSTPMLPSLEHAQRQRLRSHSTNYVVADASIGSDRIAKHNAVAGNDSGGVGELPDSTEPNLLGDSSLSFDVAEILARGGAAAQLVRCESRLAERKIAARREREGEGGGRGGGGLMRTNENDQDRGQRQGHDDDDDYDDDDDDDDDHDDDAADEETRFESFSSASAAIANGNQGHDDSLTPDAAETLGRGGSAAQLLRSESRIAEEKIAAKGGKGVAGVGAGAGAGAGVGVGVGVGAGVKVGGAAVDAQRTGAVHMVGAHGSGAPVAVWSVVGASFGPTTNATAEALASAVSSMSEREEDTMSEREEDTMGAVGRNKAAFADNVRLGIEPESGGSSNDDHDDVCGLIYRSPPIIAECGAEVSSRRRPSTSTSTSTPTSPHCCSAGGRGEGTCHICQLANSFTFSSSSSSLTFANVTNDADEDDIVVRAAELAPGERDPKDVVVDADRVLLTKEWDERGEDNLCTRHSRRHMVGMGFLAVLSVASLVGIGLGIGIALGMNRANGSGTSATAAAVPCNYSSPCVQIGPSITNPQLFSKHQPSSEDANIRIFYRSFGSAVSLSSDGKRLVASDRFADNVTVHEYDDLLGTWSQLGPCIVAPRDKPIRFSDSREHREGQSAAVISKDGRRIAVGYLFYSSNETLTRNGRIIVYEFVDGSWEQVGQDIVGSYNEAYLGRALTVDLSEDGSVVVVGDYRYDYNRGRVCVYRLVAGSWTPLGRDIKGRNNRDHFGWSVSASGDGTFVAVSASRADDFGDGRRERKRDTGYAALFRLNVGGDDYDDNDDEEEEKAKDTDWVQIGGDIVRGPGYCHVGWPVSLSSDADRVAIGGSAFIQEVYDGAPCTDFDPKVNLTAGEVRVYEYDDDEGFWGEGNRMRGSWKRMGSFEGYELGDGFGWSISLSGDGSTVAIGASNSDIGKIDRGYARVFRYSDECGNWSQVGNDFDGAEPSDWMGFALSLSSGGETFAVSAPNDFGVPDAQVSSGTVAVYRCTF